jgi:hypothetical protein
MPPPPQVWGDVQLPQLATRVVPQLSVAVTVPQDFPRRAQKAAVDSGLQGGTQTEPVQTFPLLHWVAVEQDVPHAAPLQRYVPQSLDAGDTHVPLALHVLAPVRLLPVQLAAAQTVPVGWRLQPPAPLHPPERPQVDAACAGHSPAGSWPDAMGLHVPSDPGRLQAKQAWVQAEPQQTPSTHAPLMHWLAAVQAAPVARGARHMPLSQKKPLLQSPAPAQI